MNKTKFIYLIASVVVFVVLAGMVSSEFFNKPDRVLAYVKKFRPTANIQNAEKEIEAQKASPLYSGDTLSTNPQGFALVQFMDKSFAQVKPNSQLIVNGSVENDKSTTARIVLETGEIFLNVTKRANSDFEVATNSSVASVKGTQFGARFNDYYYVLEGLVELLSNQTGETINLEANTFGQVNEDGSIDKGELSEDEVDKLKEENSEFDENLEPKVLKLRFRDENGQLREIEIEYFENDN
ncbi:MAG: FecR family protein [Balneolaceae bacterium]|nr:FecR family protein [Balneolaceae bacterium]